MLKYGKKLSKAQSVELNKIIETFNICSDVFESDTNKGFFRLCCLAARAQKFGAVGFSDFINKAHLPVRLSRPDIEGFLNVSWMMMAAEGSKILSNLEN